MSIVFRIIVALDVCGERKERRKCSDTYNSC